MYTEAFWQAIDTLTATSELIIDRPRGSTHPRYAGLYYPLDYGYLSDTLAPDGDGIDVWIGSLPECQATGIILSVDLHKRDSEAKILLGCTIEEMHTILALHNSGLQSAILVEREHIR